VRSKTPRVADKPYKLADGDGLFLLCHAQHGGRYWRMNYRHLGKQKTLAFGVYPDTGLAEAREQRDAARKVSGARRRSRRSRSSWKSIAAAVAACQQLQGSGRRMAGAKCRARGPLQRRP
jgi:hypothetical protein